MHIVIIGAGECGVRAALALREQGFEGSIDLVNGELHAPYERPPLSKPGDDGLIAKPVSGSEHLADKGITLHSGITATKIDRGTKQIVLSDGVVLPYDRLLLALGARPRRLAIDGQDVPNVHYLRHFEDAEIIHRSIESGKRVTIIGGGFIGLELAAVARQKGTVVTILEAAPRLLGRAVPAEIAAIIEARHRAKGVQVLCGTSITSIDAQGRILLGDGTQITSDAIIVGIGSLSNIDLALDSGLDIDNGIAVDGRLQTSDPSIYAAGDCCSFPHPLYGGRRIRIESWRAAQEQGDHAARAMLGSSDLYDAVPWFWSDQYDLTLQIAGMSGDAKKTVRRAIDDTALILFHLDQDGRLLAASGIGPGNAIARDIRIAEMLIAKRAHPEEGSLANPALKLKALLAA